MIWIWKKTMRITLTHKHGYTEKIDESWCNNLSNQWMCWSESDFDVCSVFSISFLDWFRKANSLFVFNVQRIKQWWKLINKSNKSWELLRIKRECDDGDPSIIIIIIIISKNQIDCAYAWT